MKTAFAEHFEEASELNWKPEIVHIYSPSPRAAITALEYIYSFVKDEETIEDCGVKTFYLVKDEEGWKFQHEHYSHPPHMEKNLHDQARPSTCPAAPNGIQLRSASH